MGRTTTLPRVLVAEDDAAIRRLLATTLRRRRLDVQVAADGQAALRALEREQWDVLVTDLMMPRVDGWHVLRWLEEHPERRPRSVIVVSATDRDVLRELDPRTVNAIIFKPFDVLQVGAYVKSATATRWPRSAARTIPAVDLSVRGAGADDGVECGKIERLGQHVADLDGQFGQALTGRRGDHDHAPQQIRIAVAQVLEELQAVHLRHGQIEHDHAVRSVGEHRQRLAAVRRRVDLEVLAPQHGDEQGADRGIILDYERAAPCGGTRRLVGEQHGLRHSNRTAHETRSGRCRFPTGTKSASRAQPWIG